MRGLKRMVGLGMAALSVILAGCGLLLERLVPETPAEFTVSDGEFLEAIRISWASSLAAGGYEVWRASAEEGPYTRIAVVAEPPYLDEEVDPGVTYWYKVRACNRAGCSPFTPARMGRAGFIPAPPTGLTASQGTFADHIRLSWEPVQGATSYTIERAQTQDGPFTSLGQTSQTFYEDRDVVAGVVYWYRVRACSRLGCSEPTPPVSGYVGSQGPPPPQNLSATDGTEPLLVLVTWDPSPGATFYKVYRAERADGEYEELEEVEETWYEDLLVEPGVVYWYKVRACSSLGCSGFSNADSGFAGEP
jgi:fibronectin type 3 domain-containing protein